MPKHVRRIVRRAEVKHMTGLPYASMYHLMEIGKFPQLIHIAGTKSVGWDYDAIVEWVEKTIDASKPAPAKTKTKLQEVTQKRGRGRPRKESADAAA